MRANIPQELDFIKEGKNADRCKEIFENEEQIKVDLFTYNFINF